MKLAIGICSIVSVIPVLVYAGYPPMPYKCPSIQSIQQAGVTQAIHEKFTDNLWLSFQPYHRFDTDEAWSFGLRDIVGVSNKEAIQVATHALVNLKLTYGPEEIVDDGRWVCVYTAGVYSAAAVTPPYPDSFKF